MGVTKRDIHQHSVQTKCWEIPKHLFSLYDHSGYTFNDAFKLFSGRTCPSDGANVMNVANVLTSLSALLCVCVG